MKMMTKKTAVPIKYIYMSRFWGSEFAQIQPQGKAKQPTTAKEASEKLKKEDFAQAKKAEEGAQKKKADKKSEAPEKPETSEAVANSKEQGEKVTSCHSSVFDFDENI